MTYKLFKSSLVGLLLGDNVVPSGNPENDAVVQGLMTMALLAVATQADSLHLMTLDTTADVLRLSMGDYVIRRPTTPESDDDLIDIDDELIPAVARYMASYLSKEKGGIHVNAADRIIKDYNAKTYEITDQMKAEAAYDGSLGGSVNVDTSWVI